MTIMRAASANGQNAVAENAGSRTDLRHGLVSGGMVAFLDDVHKAPRRPRCDDGIHQGAAPLFFERTQRAGRLAR